MKRLFVVLISFCIVSSAYSQTQLIFNNLDSVLKYAENNSISIKTNTQQQLLAKWQKISAKTGLVNLKIPTSFSLTDNIEQPVTFLPGEAFGGPPGSVKEVTTGQQYIGNFNIAPQFDIINVASWTKLKSANLNYELTETNNLLFKKTLFESISATYHNIISLQEQIEITKSTSLIADTLLLNMQNKYNEGLVRQQDLNDAKINQLSLTDKLAQLQLSLEQQNYSLKILCDIPENTDVLIENKVTGQQSFDYNLKTNNQLLYKTNLLKAEISTGELKYNRYSHFPTLSFVSYDGWQQNSNIEFFDPNAKWINSQYIGLRLSMTFPDVNRFISSKTASINRTIAVQNAEHSKLQNEMNNAQLNLDYEKAFSTLNTTEKIYKLKEENYRLALNQFNESILSSDRLLAAFNEMLLSRLNYANAAANCLFTKSKIEINNSIK